MSSPPQGCWRGGRRCRAGWGRCCAPGISMSLCPRPTALRSHRARACPAGWESIAGGKASWVGMLQVSRAVCCSRVAGPAPTRWVLSPVPWKESHGQGQRDFRAFYPEFLPTLKKIKDRWSPRLSCQHPCLRHSRKGPWGGGLFPPGSPGAGVP